MRLIDADAVIADLEKWKQNPNNDDSSVDLVNHFQGILRTEPSIDIVRCQDCKYWVYNFNGCSRNPCTEPWLATDFCNYGEKK